VGHVAFGELSGLEDERELLRLLAHLDDVAGAAAIGRDVHPPAVHVDMAVVDELARGEDRGDELGTIDDRVEARFQKADQVLRGLTLAANGLLVNPAELLFRDVSVVALQLLLGAKLQAVVGKLALAALAMLAGAVFAP